MSDTSQQNGSNGPSLARRVAIAALLIALGNIASRLLGLIRTSVMAATFGRGGEVDAFVAASTVPTTLYDLLLSGALSAALVPVLTEYADRNDREFWRIASTMINLLLVVAATAILVLGVLAPWLADVLAGGLGPGLRATTETMIRWMLPAVLFMVISGLITALSHARQHFLLPSFTTSVYNLAIIICALALTPRLGIYSLVAGVLFGALGQVLLQAPGLKGIQYRPTIDLRHPGVRKILTLYAPVTVGITFSIIGTTIDRNLATQQGQSALATMAYATTLIQFPLGLVATAVSFAVLPTLSRQVAQGEEQAFRRTLAMGIKVVLLLIFPATAALLALAVPVVGTIFQYRNFSAADTISTAWALRLYLPGLPAAAIDQMLLFAFYAHKRTLTPNLVQGGAIAVYLITALSLLATTNLGYGALILGNSAQWVSHMLLLLVLARGLVQLRGLRLGEAALKSGLASVALAGVAAGVVAALAAAGVASPLVQLLIAGTLGALVYAGVCLALRVEALDFFVQAVRQRLQRRAGAPHA